MAEYDAVVVGSGPNGLAAALILAGAGLSVTVYEAASTLGGGMRTAELTLPGFRHDVCSAVHPMALASPFFAAFDLARHGIEMLQPKAAFAHPLDGGRAAIGWPDLNRTADGLGVDARSWRSLFAPLADRWPGVVGAAVSDMRSVPADFPAALRLTQTLGRLAVRGARQFRGDAARAMFAGIASHAIAPPDTVAATGVGVVLTALAHSVGWPIPRGGSQTIADALIAEAARRGVTFVTDHRVGSLDELPPSRAVMLDVAPGALLRIGGDRLPSSYRRSLESFRHGGGACKVDFALSGPVPWTAPDCRDAGTLHLVGSWDEAVAAERAVAEGRHPDRPYVLAVQPGVVDDSRAPDGHHVLWTYAHVPNGSTMDVREQVTSQVERFAPGFRDLVLAAHVVTAAEQELHNPNYVGGDISGGLTTMRQMVRRPVPRWDPYRTPIPGVYLCSSSTPPGQAVHGMCGVHAAGRALRQRFGLRGDPLALVGTAQSGVS